MPQSPQRTRFETARPEGGSARRSWQLDPNVWIQRTGKSFFWSGMEEVARLDTRH